MSGKGKGSHGEKKSTTTLPAKVVGLQFPIYGSEEHNKLLGRVNITAGGVVISSCCSGVHHHDHWLLLMVQ
jgi:hypothetical protein